jgi:hypothetical protein
MRQTDRRFTQCGMTVSMYTVELTTSKAVQDGYLGRVISQVQGKGQFETQGTSDRSMDAGRGIERDA